MLSRKIILALKFMNAKVPNQPSCGIVSAFIADDERAPCPL
jgi:hypothetical protein